MQRRNWDDFRYILAISRGGSIAAAAKSLHVDSTTVSRRLAALQTNIGARLYHRLKNGELQLTETGERAARLAEEVEQEMGLLTAYNSTTDDAVSGIVRLTSAPVVVNRILVPAIRTLVDCHPALKVELIAEARDLSLTRREADLAIRLARPKTGGTQVIARRIGMLGYFEYAPISCSERETSTIPWIIYDGTMAHLPQAHWMAKKVTTGENSANIRVNDVETAIEAVSAGLGRSLLPSSIADLDNRLQRIGGRSSEPVLRREMWLLSHKEQRHVKRIEAVIAWIEQTVPR